MLNIEKLIQETHRIAVEKGWYDKEVPFENHIVNIYGEISEAWEDWRNNHGLNEIYWECKDIQCPDDHDCEKCQVAKPCGIPIELVDTVIRICDMFGAYRANLENISMQRNLIGSADTFAKFIQKCYSYIYHAGVKEDAWVFSWLLNLIWEIEYYCRDNDIDLAKAIELKMAYNRLRPYRHGDKKA